MELGITGHQTRGDEVIKILETLGGKNRIRLTGCNDKYFYCIKDEGKNIINSNFISHDEIKGYEIFSLEDFLEKFPYKVGDKVNVWVNYEHLGGPRAELEVAEIKSMRWNSARCEIAYRLKDITKEIYKNVIKGKVNDDENLFHTINEYEEIVEKSFQGGYEKCKLDIQLNGYELPDGYHFTDENGNVIDAKEIKLVKNPPYYPKNYDECCEVLNIPNDERYIDIDVPLDYNKVLSAFVKLLIYRNAYWKIAGEQLGLGKPWEPDWNDNNQPKFGIHNVQNDIRTINLRVLKNLILVFPTEEMRDTFYNNFKDLIEECKEML